MRNLDLVQAANDIAFGASPSLLGRNTSVPTLNFSLTREPLSRFVSGYTEVMYRAWEHRTEGPLGTRRDNATGALFDGLNAAGERWTWHRCCTVEHASDFVRAFIAGKIDDGHLHLQSATALAVGLDVLGHVEDIQSTWRKLQRNLGCFDNMTKLAAFPDYADDFKLVHHSVGDNHDPFGTNASMHALLDRDGTVLRALLLVLAPDYAVFDYPLPAVGRRQALRL